MSLRQYGLGLSRDYVEIALKMIFLITDWRILKSIQLDRPGVLGRTSFPVVFYSSKNR